MSKKTYMIEVPVDSEKYSLNRDDYGEPMYISWNKKGDTYRDGEDFEFSDNPKNWEIEELNIQDDGKKYIILKRK